MHDFIEQLTSQISDFKTCTHRNAHKHAKISKAKNTA